MIRNNKKFNRRVFFLLSFLFVSLGLFAQKITVKGVVNDATGEPVIGANIIIKGTSVGTITDFDGNFTLMQMPKMCWSFHLLVTRMLRLKLSLIWL